MKRRISRLFAVLFLINILIPSFSARGWRMVTAAGEEVSESITENEDIPMRNSFDLRGAGVGFDIPEELYGIMGAFQPNYGNELGSGSGIYVSGLTYCAMPKEKYNELAQKGNLTKEETDYAVSRMFDLVLVFAIDGGRTLEDLSKEMSAYGLNVDDYLEAGSAGEYHFYYKINPDAEYVENQITFDEGFREEFDAMLPVLENPSWIRVYEPEGAAAKAGTQIRFETTDLDGNPVRSEDIFRENTLTMVNIWGTYCGPCINEMPDLEELNSRLKEKGCGIVGIVCDVRSIDDQATIDSAKQILDQTGVTYLNLLPWNEFYTALPAEYIPTTYFVDPDGILVGKPAVGARGADDYEALLDSLLGE